MLVFCTDTVQGALRVKMYGELGLHLLTNRQ